MKNKQEVNGKHSKFQYLIIIQQETHLYHQNYCKLIGIDLSRQKDTSIPLQNNFTEEIEEDDYAKKIFFFLLKSSKKLF